MALQVDANGIPYLDHDSFGLDSQVLHTAGWVVESYSRYDPTVIVGLTPTGKVFNARLDGDTVSLTIAGNTRTRTVPKATWLPGNATVQALLGVLGDFPAPQR